MNELDKAHLQKRLSQLHEQRLKELSLEDDLGMETGYVTDSSINSRKGGEVKIEALPLDQTPINKSRKTKSERDKRRSSRVSLLDSKNDSGSENSSESATEEKQLRYRKRAGSKRIEAGSEVKESQDSRRKRAGSKNVNRLSITVPPPEDSEESALSDFQPTTLQMNRKDIYSGTWNPKERAVLDQVLNNMDVKSDPKKSFMGMFKRQRSTKQNNNNKEKNIGKIVEDTEEEHCTDSTGRDKYPLNQYYSDSERNVKKHNNKMGLFRKLKESVKQRHEEALLDRQLAHYMPSPSQKKKGIFSKFTASGKKKESGGRCRAHSSNDYARSVGVYIPPEEEKGVKETKPTNQENKSNLSKGKSGSFKNLFSSSRAKSVDNLNGAFEYYANPKTSVSTNTKHV
ncbi:uncharacterized protein [Clytia hemisphaerica]|uniref:Uncharacterized protein n=1 Tax=Clytia hemisphaerica TaxID=252671 RepID=A0A7M5XJ97_9CNID